MARLLRPLLLLLASQAFAWDFNGAAEVKQFLAENEDALLACEFVFECIQPTLTVFTRNTD